MINYHLEAIISENSKKFIDNDRFYILTLAALCIAVPIIWLHGRTIYFWDGALPFKPYYDLKYLNYSWEQLNGLGYPDPINKFIWVLAPYLVLLPLTGSLWIVQDITISLLLFTASSGIFYLLKHLSLVADRIIHPVFLFLPALLYIANYYSVFVYNDFYPGLFPYTILPFSVLIMLLMLENLKNLKKVLLFSILFSLTLEFASPSFTILTPMVVYFSLAVIGIAIIFWHKIIEKTGKISKLFYVRGWAVFLSVVVLTNFWIISNFLVTIHTQSTQSGAGSLSVIYTDFTTLGAYPAKWLSTIAIYPQLFPSVYTNNFPWIGLYSFSEIIFPVIGVIFFIVLMLPLAISRHGNRSHVFGFRIKIGIYFFFFFVLFFALQGINPVNRYIYFFMQSHMPSLMPYLYGSRLPFTRLDIVFLSTILFFVSISEISIGNAAKGTKKHPKTNNDKASKTKLNLRKIFLTVIIVLILVVYPFYFYTPASMQVYNTGHGDIQSTVVFPKYFYNLSDYVSVHSEGSDMLILPLSYDFLSMNFSAYNTFADDSFPGYLFGTPAISGAGNSTLYNSIYDEMLMPGTNFSSFLNNINVKFVLLNTIFDQYAHGYPSETNLTLIKNYLNSQTGLKVVGPFGPLLLYVNKYYDGTVQTGKTFELNSSIYSKQNYLPLNPYFSTINTSLNPNLPGYSNVSYTYNGSMDLRFSNLTPQLIGHSYFFTNGINFTANLSEYRYLVITAQSTNGSNQNGTYFEVSTQTYLQNSSTGTYDIKPTGSSTYDQGNSTFHTYIYKLFGNILNSDARVSSHPAADGSGSLVNRITIGVGWHRYSVFPAYLNISKIRFTRSVSPGSGIYSGGNISLTETAANLSELNNSGAEVSYHENNPTRYTVVVHNSSGVFPLILKQNFNSGWILRGIPEGNYTHFLADNYANGWIIDEKGNFTFEIEFSTQKTYDMINIEAVSANLIFISLAVGMVYLEYIRRIKK